MDPFEGGSLRAWRLETKYDTDGQRHHQRPSGSDCWRIVKPLGSGAQGVVWQEQCLSEPSENALRVVKRLRKHQSKFSEMSRRELNALATFSNSHIPEVR